MCHPLLACRCTCASSGLSYPPALSKALTKPGCCCALQPPTYLFSCFVLLLLAATVGLLFTVVVGLFWPTTPTPIHLHTRVPCRAICMCVHGMMLLYCMTCNNSVQLASIERCVHRHAQRVRSGESVASFPSVNCCCVPGGCWLLMRTKLVSASAPFSQRLLCLELVVLLVQCDTHIMNTPAYHTRVASVFGSE